MGSVHKGHGTRARAAHQAGNTAYTVLLEARQSAAVREPEEGLEKGYYVKPCEEIVCSGHTRMLAVRSIGSLLRKAAGMECK